MPAIPLFFLNRWHTYPWANYGPRYSPALFSAFTIDQISPTTARVAMVPGPGGQWQALYGPVSTKYSAASKRVACQPGIGSQVILTDLQPSALYYANLVLDGALANPAGLPITGAWYTDEQSFTTQALAPPASPVISNIAAAPGTPTAAKCTITWTTDIPSDSTVTWDHNPITGSSPSAHDPTLVTSHSMVIPVTGSLLADADYQYVVSSTSASGGSAMSTEQTFTAPS